MSNGKLVYYRLLVFSLDLKQCAVTGQNNLYYVSPKTGKAVSKEGAEKFAPNF